MSNFASVPKQAGQMPISAMQALYSTNQSLIPLGGGDDGKSPLVRFQGRKRLPFKVVVDQMVKANSEMYGLLLPGLVVVDCDTDNEQTADYVRSRFGQSLFQVQTPRGRHHYFRPGQSSLPSRVRQEDVSIDIKTGQNSYVVGPQSIRPDGGHYLIDIGRIDSLRNLPPISDLQPNAKPLGRVPNGERTFHLWKIAREFAETCNSQQELYEELCSVRDWELECPETVSDAQIWKTVKWTWTKRLQGELYGGAVSVARIFNHEREALMPHTKGPDALALLYHLRHCHAAQKGKRFAIATNEMFASGFYGWTEWRIRQARNLLVQIGLLNRVKRGGGTAGPGLYQLSSMPVAACIS